MKRIISRALPSLAAFFIVLGTPAAGELNPIIPEWDAAIQILNTAGYDQWPGINSPSPLEIALGGDRIWLVWPEALVSLDGNGHTDEKTLLALFFSSPSAPGGNPWSPEGGVLCSDGQWRGIRGSYLEVRNPFTGSRRSREWPEETPESIHAAPEGSLLVLSDRNIRLVISRNGENGENEDVSDELLIITPVTGAPPLSQLAVSGNLPLAAWREAPGNTVKKIHFPGGLEKLSSEEPGNRKPEGKLLVGFLGTGVIEDCPVPEEGIVWGMAWAGPYLVFAQSGRLYALDSRGAADGRISVLDDSRLPDRWFRIYGGARSLAVHSPETGMLGIVRPGDTSTAREAYTESSDFASLVLHRSLEAGEYLKEQGFHAEAEKFYRWIIPHVRAGRSRFPLEELWPELEEKVTKQRLELRQR